MLVDGNALVHRAYHAFPPTLTTKDGELVNAVFGFSRMLLDAILDLHPDYVGVAFDITKPTERLKNFPEYKAQRVKADDELIAQFPRVKEIVQTFGFPAYGVQGWEADDVIATLTGQARAEGLETIIVTGDKDTMQLVDGAVAIYTAKKGVKDTALYGQREVRAKLGVDPAHVPDLKALAGDPSDNIAGVPGIGEKTAASLIQQYGAVENIVRNIQKLPEKIAAKIKPMKDNLPKLKTLVTLKNDLPIELDLAAMATNHYNKRAVEQLFYSLEFKSLIPRLPETVAGNHKQEKLF